MKSPKVKPFRNESPVDLTHLLILLDEALSDDALANYDLDSLESFDSTLTAILYRIDQRVV